MERSDALNGLTDKCTKVAASWSHTCARSKDGKVWCWGENQHGQLGDGSKTTRYSPVAAKGISSAVAIDVSNEVSCAATSSGAVWCWGTSTDKMLGPNQPKHSLLPVRIPGFGDSATK